jgi:hypothetical protein
LATDRSKRSIRRAASLAPTDFPWGAGLAKLLEKLEEDSVPKDPKFNRTAVNEWWRTQFSAEQGLRQEPEEYLSNWFPITLPTHIYFHSLSRKSVGVLEVSPALPYPAVQGGRRMSTIPRNTICNLHHCDW